jgi:hypothetical protein
LRLCEAERAAHRYRGTPPRINAEIPAPNCATITPSRRGAQQRWRRLLECDLSRQIRRKLGAGVAIETVTVRSR